MLISADVMRWMLLFTLLGMALIAALYLAKRQLPVYSYVSWGVVILLMPVLGPFLAILTQPGYPRRKLTARQRRYRRMQKKTKRL